MENKIRTRTAPDKNQSHADGGEEKKKFELSTAASLAISNAAALSETDSSNA